MDPQISGPQINDPDFAGTSSVPSGSFQAPPPTYTVSGGVGSISYVLAEIAAAGLWLQRIADQLAGTAAGVADAVSFLDEATFGLYSYPFQTLEQVRAASQGCRDCQTFVQEIAAEATSAAVRYEQAEADNARFLAVQGSTSAYYGGMQLRLGMPLAAPVFALWQGGAAVEDARRRGLRDVIEDSVSTAPEYLAGLLGLPQGLATLLTRQPADGGLARRPLGINAAVGARRFFDRAGMFLPGDLQLARLQPAEWNPAQTRGVTVLEDGSALGTMAPTLHDLYAGSKGAYSVAPSAIVVKRIDRGVAAPVWIVDLPGTEVWQPLDSSNPWDLEGDLEGMTSAQRGSFAQKQILIEEWVKAALRDAGALPFEGVMINAHSGGGIQAAAMAANPAFLAEVNVRIINIAGAPAANQAVTPGIKVLDLQNTDDLGPAADLRKPPDTADWVTVTTSPRPGPAANPGRLVLRAHELNGYVADAALLDHSLDSSVLAHRQAVLGFFGAAVMAGSVGYRKYVYQGTDRNRSPAGARTPGVAGHPPGQDPPAAVTGPPGPGR
ncbi:MAG: hypothetical protein M3017_15325 [Actinomycetota bacterium]|nr:hypothetical protein [Actinomycetota bacterium]